MFGLLQVVHRTTSWRCSEDVGQLLLSFFFSFFFSFWLLSFYLFWKHIIYFPFGKLVSFPHMVFLVPMGFSPSFPFQK